MDTTAKVLITRADHYAQLKKSGVVDPASILPDFPKQFFYIWDWFNELRHLCGDELTPVNIKAFFELKRIEPTAFEIESITLLYLALQKHIATEMKRSR